MRKHVLFIQGAGEGAYREDKKLVESLTKLLGSTYDVHYPEMKDEDDAHYERWAAQLEDEIAGLGAGVILVGHSVGASTLIKWLMETRMNTTPAAVFLIAAPFWGPDGGWTYDGYEELVLPQDSDSQFSRDVPVYLYHSDNDETVPFSHLELYSRRFPQATVRRINGRGHQMNDDLSEVAKDIKELS